jgi:hypothetical protein
MEWLLPYYWAAALSPSAVPTMWWGWPDRTPQGPAPDDESCAEPTALDLKIVEAVYEVLVERVCCASCGAALDEAVNVKLSRGFFNAAAFMVATRCRGLRRHRHVASVLKRAGELRFGRLHLAQSH